MRAPVLAFVFLGSAAVAPLAAQRINLPVSRQELETRVKADSNDPAAHYNVALAYWNEKRWDDAERELRSAAALDGKFAEAFLALAYLPYARRPKLWEEELDDRVPKEWEKPIEESDRNYRRAFLVNPLVDIRIQAAVKPGRSALWDLFGSATYDLFYQAFDDMAMGKYEDAHGRFVRYEREKRLAGPGTGKIPMSFLWFQGLAAAHTQRWDEAIRKFGEVMDRAAEAEKKAEEKDLIRVPLRTNEYRYFLATFQQAAGNTGEALRLYREVLEKDIGVYMAHVQMANIYEGQRDYENAVAERRRAVDAMPDDPSLLTDLGLTLGKAGQLAEATQTLQQAIDAAPRDARPVFWLGLVQVQAGQKAEAKATLTRFLAMAPARYDKQIALAKQRLAGL
ncbi:MAG TPA: tetratricopeptide repeat protein [Gemmatimonadales bacterium]|nr:tetratricopeptide repeat protein [Gemmatimonadales bacterium]